MNIIKPALIYFFIVFGAGFILGSIRVLLVVPEIGTRWAELLETPVMGTVIYFAAGYLNKRFPLDPGSRLRVGLVALSYSVAAELTVAVFLQDRSIGDALFNRDPVSGTAFYALLGLFAIMPRCRAASVTCGAGLGRS